MENVNYCRRYVDPSETAAEGRKVEREEEGEGGKEEAESEWEEYQIKRGVVASECSRKRDRGVGRNKCVCVREGGGGKRTERRERLQGEVTDRGVVVDDVRKGKVWREGVDADEGLC